MDEPTKACTKCALIKPHTSFHRDRSTRDGLSRRCKTCIAEYHRSHYAKNSERILARIYEQRAANITAYRERERQRAARDYAADSDVAKRRQADWRAANRERARQISRESYVRHCDKRRGQARDYQRLWRESHPRESSVKDKAKRACRRNRGTLVIAFTAEQLRQRLSMYQGCWICGSTSWDTVDHVKPVAAGGPHILANLRPACRSCNSSKGSTWPITGLLSPRRK